MKAHTKNTQEQQAPNVQKTQNAAKNESVATIADYRPTTVVQRKLQDTMGGAKAPIQRKSPLGQSQVTNNTGLPDQLKSGIENLSGYSMDDVQVHYNSSKPAQLQAHAYAQGTDIHLGPGQAKHLPHEAWHVVQQKQGRVKPTRQLKSKVNINDDAGLEKEADVMGASALSNTVQNPKTSRYGGDANRVASQNNQTYQLVFNNPLPDDGEKNMLDGLISFGILEFIGRDGKHVDTIRDNNFLGMGTKRSLTPISFLGGGAQKVAYQLDDTWVLLTHRDRQKIVDEVEELLRIEALGARIPNMMKVTPRPPATNDTEEYILTTSIKEIDFKTNSITRDMEKMNDLAKKNGINGPNTARNIRRGVNAGRIRPSEEEKDGQRKRHALARNNFLGQLANEHYWGNEDQRAGFVQQRIIGTELGKNLNANQNFNNVVTGQSIAKQAVSKADLILVEQALVNGGVWGDFALFHETATGHIYVFDPDPTSGNGTRNPLQIVQYLINLL